MTLANPKAFFDRVRGADLLGPTLTPSEVAGCNAILAACEGWPVAFTAYALATAYHETAGTMQPIKERGGEEYLRRNYDVTGRDPARARKMGNAEPGDGVRWCGRGYVMLTWFVNYQRAARELGEPITANPDLAMRPDIAAKIMRLGMGEGWFTGKGLSRYLPSFGKANAKQFTNARRVINGLDRADDVCRYALDFQEALVGGEWF